MINKGIAYDNNASDLGVYFEKCYKNINRVTSTLGHVTEVMINGTNCNHSNTCGVATGLNAKPFVFVALSHGNDTGDSLVAHDDYINTTNSKEFKNSFFYTTACNTAKILGPDLITKNCVCFIGYDQPAFVSHDEFHDVYIECENHSINEFFRTEKTIQETFDEMIQLFTSKMVEYFVAGETLFAMELMKNMEALKLYGNGSLTSKDFHI